MAPPICFCFSLSLGCKFVNHPPRLFDRIDHVYVDDPLVPLYQAVKRAPDTPPESVSYRGRVPAATAVPVPTDPRGQRLSSYSRAPPVPRAFAVPPGAASAAVGGGRSVPVRVPSESYSRVDMATGDARRHLPMPPQHTSGWDSSASRGNGSAAAGGEAVPSRRLPPASYASGPTARPEAMFREGGQDRGFETGREARGAWPQHQQQPGRWRAGDIASSPSVTAAVPTESQAFRRGASGWGNGASGGWS